MAQIKITDSAGKSAGTIEVSDGIFAIEPNGACIHQVVRSQMAARRQGTHDTKT
ncbi:MAG: 50S ribosomal protein L4, partial [Bacteroidales bacterium]